MLILIIRNVVPQLHINVYGYAFYLDTRTKDPTSNHWNFVLIINIACAKGHSQQANIP